MKKIFTLIVMCVLAISAQAKITIYVQCETAPFLWTWGAVGGTFDNVGNWPGELQLTDKFTHPDTGEEFWMYAFPEEITQISFLFNDGNTPTKQTGDIKEVTTDRYFILAWDDGAGNVSCQDVTGDYIEIPDAEVTSMGISGNHNGWEDPSTVQFEVVEAGKTFKYTINPAELVFDDIAWKFKFRPNQTSWLGFWEVYYWDQPDAETGVVPDPVEGKTAISQAPEWLQEDGGNFMIDTDTYKADSFTFTLTWGGGKLASENWTLTAEAQNLVITGINNVKATNVANTAIYNLQGQRINSNFRGIAIQNGKKMLMK